MITNPTSEHTMYKYTTTPCQHKIYTYIHYIPKSEHTIYTYNTPHVRAYNIYVHTLHPRQSIQCIHTLHPMSGNIMYTYTTPHVRAYTVYYTRIYTTSSLFWSFHYRPILPSDSPPPHPFFSTPLMCTLSLHFSPPPSFHFPSSLPPTNPSPVLKPLSSGLVSVDWT